MAGIFKNLDKSDIRLTPFRAYKRFTELDNYTAYAAELSTSSVQLGNEGLTNSTQFTSDDKLKDSIWNSIDALFYRHYYTNPKGSFGSINHIHQPRILHNKAHVISLPQKNYGEGIEPLSLRIEISEGSVFTDDLYGNLIPENVLNPLPLSASKVVFKLKPTLLTKKLGITINDTIQYGTDLYPSTVVYNNVIAQAEDSSPIFEVRHQFTKRSNPTATSSIVIKPESAEVNSLFNFTDRDYSVVFNITPDTIAGYENQVIVEKYDRETQPYLDVNGSSVGNTMPNYKYPYRLSYNGTTQKLQFEKTNGADRIFFTSSATYIHGTNAALTRNEKTISLLYYDVSNTVTQDDFDDPFVMDNIDFTCGNDSNIYVGATATGASGSNMHMGSLYFYDEAIDNTQLAAIGYGWDPGSYNYPEAYVGNVFRKHGLAVITEPGWAKYLNDGTYSITNIEYRGTTTFYENEVSCTIRPGELNRSTNPTMYYYNPNHNQFELQDFATGSGFIPYITRIGLYNDNNELVVIGSLSQPIQPPQNVDTTIVVKYDV
jgi:hypothetical protein